jgi:hypothetical protein
MHPNSAKEIFDTSRDFAVIKKLYLFRAANLHSPKPLLEATRPTQFSHSAEHGVRR